MSNVEQQIDLNNSPFSTQNYTQVCTYLSLPNIKDIKEREDGERSSNLIMYIENDQLILRPESLKVGKTLISKGDKFVMHEGKYAIEKFDLNSNQYIYIPVKLVLVPNEGYHNIAVVILDGEM